MSGWIGVDLDGTLAEYGGPLSHGTIGRPVPAMLARVRRWLAEGWEVRIFTARACVPEQIPPVQQWLQTHGLPPLVVTNVKDFGMLELWDDRAIQVEHNTGRQLSPGVR